jgi:hypothetical protein
MSEARYNLSDLADYLADFPTLLEDTPKKKIDRAAMMPVAVGSFVYDPNATINPEIYRALFENDLGFRLTWSVKRTDFKDQSQSSYDLALANIFYEAGVSDQEAVNALVHHRRLRKFDPKPDPQYYYRRTLSLARAKSASSNAHVGELQASMEALVTGQLSAESTLDQAERIVKPTVKGVAVAADGAAPSPAPATTKTREQWLEEFNANLDLRIEGQPVLVKRNVWVRGTKPTWRMELDNKEIITLTNAQQWLTYVGMREAVVSQVNGTIVIPNRKNDWLKFIVPQFQRSLEAENAEEENDIRGDTREMLLLYLRQRGIVLLETIWTDPANLYLPTIYKGHIAVYAKDVCETLARSTGDKYEKHQLISGLSALKAEREKINGPKSQSQSRYLLPDDWEPERFSQLEAAARLGVPAPVEKESSWQT